MLQLLPRSHYMDSVGHRAITCKHVARGGGGGEEFSYLS